MSVFSIQYTFPKSEPSIYTNFGKIMIEFVGGLPPEDNNILSNYIHPDDSIIYIEKVISLADLEKYILSKFDKGIFIITELHNKKSICVIRNDILKCWLDVHFASQIK